MSYRLNDSGPWVAAPEELVNTETPLNLRSLLQAIGLIAVMACLLNLSIMVDENHYEQARALARMEAKRAPAPKEIAAAYERGLADAMKSIRATPQGIELAQACLASGYGRGAR